MGGGVKVKSTLPSGSSVSGAEKRKPDPFTDRYRWCPLTIIESVGFRQVSVVLMEKNALHVALFYLFYRTEATNGTPGGSAASITRFAPQ